MASNPPTRPNHLEPSPLGTKEYWDSLYTTELHNHTADTSDMGTIWFSDSGAEDKVLSFLSSHILPPKSILGPETTRQNCSFLDLGTGNGHFLLRLRGFDGDEDDEEDVEGEKWEGRMLGVDYSAQSVEFARRIAGSRGAEVEFEYFDLMTDSPASILTRDQAAGWDVVLDKGTFDAISLSEERDGRGRRLCEGYRERVVPLVREGGLLLVTSCNWTGEELRAWFAGAGLRVVGEVGYRSFVFGGAQGADY
ncbi:Protein-lysine N-methyltransferase EFM4 [Lachnellula arida]|uniref:Protein-lysine N-methyltransferase EFM4 n=1 Tax=Lachnellula arida TaxID=1316785 RepID=A0A8T9B4R7_9HELO|nr:Protein-lysine N-methyltransferase EFM4 [Lachnellula arida]